MALESKVWRVDADRPEQLKASRLDEEKRLEDWLCRDVGLLNEKLLIIGRQISMSGGSSTFWLWTRKRTWSSWNSNGTRRRAMSCANTRLRVLPSRIRRDDVEFHTREFLEIDFDKAFMQRFGHEAPET